MVKDGKLVYKVSGMPVCTTEGSKWIFVLSTSRVLYVGQVTVNVHPVSEELEQREHICFAPGFGVRKRKGAFQHSSFLAGAATTAAGRLVAAQGVLQAIWPYSGHYLPTEDNFKEFITFLENNNVDLSNVKRCSVDDDEYPSFEKRNDEMEAEANNADAVAVSTTVEVTEATEPSEDPRPDDAMENRVDEVVASEFGKHIPRRWTTAAGARIGCVGDYPPDLRSKALEQANLSPRVTPSPSGGRVPIPSPRPSPGVRLSPRLQYMGIPTPTVALTLPKHVRR
ncbi:IQ calmodulin-binding motif [Musa troglodytarum]|uniref:IQ calmodulin-binding motif n=1 Tax=Musa troglodytarum TaxID=320322 RepID=A0A9E7JBW6_9LILI|nr:IQ calmodulin-binding motif [Musa troglodytarum]